MKNPRTRKLTRISGADQKAGAVRLSAADRAMMKDMARVGILDSEIATKHHYAHLKNGASRSLDRLEKAGFITSTNVVHDNKRTRAYTFASKEMAKAWGGQMPVIGARRMEFHELVTSKIYFELKKPDDFRLAHEFTKGDLILCGEIRPDAMYTNTDGEIVFVEADSGHYTKTQIQKKMLNWQNVKQVWGQPQSPTCKVSPSDNLQVITI